jgi:FAD/FMN-containing dehydrogenase
MRKHGLTCDNLISADLVTAEGESLTAGEQQHPDLFWAIRGGGGNFGIVTSFTFRLHPHGPEVLAGPILFAADQAESVLRAYRDFVVEAPDELGTVVILTHAPPAPWLPDSIHGQPVVIIAMCYAGPVEEGRRVVAPLRRLGTPLADVVGPTRYIAHQSMLDPGVPHGHHYYWKSHYSKELSDDAIRTLVERAWQVRSPMSYIIIFHLGGAVGRVSEDATAFHGRRAVHAINIDAVWPADMEAGREDIEWARGMWEALAPFSTGGVYMNFLGNEGPERVRAAYGLKNYERLRAIKQQYDPSNFFRMNQNIRPAGSGGESEIW